MKQKKKRKIKHNIKLDIAFLIIIIACIGLIISGYQIFNWYQDNNKVNKQVELIEDKVEVKEVSDKVGNAKEVLRKTTSGESKIDTVEQKRKEIHNKIEKLRTKKEKALVILKNPNATKEQKENATKFLNVYKTAMPKFRDELNSITKV